MEDGHGWGVVATASPARASDPLFLIDGEFRLEIRGRRLVPDRPCEIELFYPDIPETEVFKWNGKTLASVGVFPGKITSSRRGKIMVRTKGEKQRFLWDPSQFRFIKELH